MVWAHANIIPTAEAYSKRHRDEWNRTILRGEALGSVSASQSGDDFLDAGVFVTQLACEPENTHALLDRIVEIYQGAENGLSNNEVDQARNKLLSRVVLAGERPRQRLFSLGLEWAHLGRYRSVPDDLATLDKISREDLHRILAEWHLPASSSTVLAGPLLNVSSSS